MPTLVLLAGPNGAGKTTFINGFLRERAEAFQFVNPDEVARDLTRAGRARDLAAGRRVLERLDELVAARADFVLETTLATRSHAVRIRDWKAAGYRFELVYLRLPSAEHSISRVAHRVAQGGHGIPEDTLRRRFVVSGEYLESTYKPLADDWKIYASGGDMLELLDLGTAMNKSIFDHETILKAGRRAADMAKNGTREEKSGKFLPPPGWKGRLITGTPGELDDLKPKPAKGKAA